jgi:AcrR family transcriptional regulator
MTADLKQRVLDASVQLIHDVGLAGLSMREVARRAGVSHQAPYHHFADKAAIVAALVEHGFTMLASRMEAAERTGPPDQRMRRVGRAYVDFALEQPVHFRLMFRPELSDPARFPAAHAAGGRAFAVLDRLVGEIAGPRASRSRKDALVSMHWSLVHGLSTLLLDGPLASELGADVARGRHVDHVLTLFLER